MTVPDEAIEAAAEWLPHSGDCEVRPERDCTCWEPRVNLMRAALEAAAPYLRAQALEDAAQLVTPDIDPELCTTIYDPWDVAAWLRARAAAERGPDV